MNKRRPAKWLGFALALVLALGADPVSSHAQKDVPPLKLRMSPSVAPDVSDRQMQGIVRPFTDLIADKTGYPIQFELDKSHGPEDFVTVGAELSEGTYHVKGMWGVEYGWMAQKYPNLQVIAAASAGERSLWFSQLMVSRNHPATGLAQLKGKRIARFKHASLMDRLVLDDLIRKEGFDPQTFFVELEKPLSDARQAIRAVKNGEAECVLVEHGAFTRLEAAQPNLAKALKVLKESAPYPAPVIVGLPENVDRLKPGLWRHLQGQVIKMHETAEGQQLILTLRFESLVKPGAEFLKQIEKAAKDYPSERLSHLK